MRLTAEPDYIQLVSGRGEVFLYSEHPEDGLTRVSAQRLDSLGAAVAPPVSIVQPLVRPFGPPFVSPAGLTVALLTGDSEDQVTLVVQTLAETHETTPLKCDLPPTPFGSVVETNGVWTVFYETGAGDLMAFSTDATEPSCPALEDHRRILAAPLPERYVIGQAGGDLLVAGRQGDTYALFIVGAGLTRALPVRVSPGTAHEPGDFTVVDDQLRGRSLLVFTAEQGGSRDVHMARLGGFAAAPSPSDRVVATAETEHQPSMYEGPQGWMVTWVVETDRGRERLVLAAPLPDDDVAIAGGEILWRIDATQRNTRSWTWTTQGFLRASAHAGGVDLSLYRPTFW